MDVQTAPPVVETLRSRASEVTREVTEDSHSEPSVAIHQATDTSYNNPLERSQEGLEDLHQDRPGVVQGTGVLHNGLRDSPRESPEGSHSKPFEGFHPATDILHDEPIAEGLRTEVPEAMTGKSMRENVREQILNKSSDDGREEDSENTVARFTKCIMM